jgi:hypothetical protein
VLKDVRDLKNYIFATYYDPQRDVMTWVKEPSPDGDSTDQLELVAQLDQVYGYMMWLTPALPPEDRAVWSYDLQRLARIMITQFFTPRENMFWGRNHELPGSPAGSAAYRLWTHREKLVADLPNRQVDP